jgi:hypothetical protein
LINEYGNEEKAKKEMIQFISESMYNTSNERRGNQNKEVVMMGETEINPIQWESVEYNDLEIIIIKI